MFTLYDQVTLTQKGIEKLISPFEDEIVPFVIPDDVTFTIIGLLYEDESLRGFTRNSEVEIRAEDYDKEEDIWWINECEKFRISSADGMEMIVCRDDIQ